MVHGVCGRGVCGGGGGGCVVCGGRGVGVVGEITTSLSFSSSNVYILWFIIY